MQKLTYSMKLVNFCLGQYVYKEGDEPDGVYLGKLNFKIFYETKHMKI